MYRVAVTISFLAALTACSGAPSGNHSTNQEASDANATPAGDAADAGTSAADSSSEDALGPNPSPDADVNADAEPPDAALDAQAPGTGPHWPPPMCGADVSCATLLPYYMNASCQCPTGQTCGGGATAKRCGDFTEFCTPYVAGMRAPTNPVCVARYSNTGTQMFVCGQADVSRLPDNCTVVGSASPRYIPCDIQTGDAGAVEALSTTAACQF